MKTASSLLCRLAALAAGFALILATVSSASTNPQPTLQPLADQKAPALPLAISFEKGPPGENGGPYILKAKNTSQASLTLHAVIRWSVISHGSAKTIELPPHVLAPDEVWSIDKLAVEDRITLSAEGFETLDLKVPPGKSEKE